MHKVKSSVLQKTSDKIRNRINDRLKKIPLNNLLMLSPKQQNHESDSESSQDKDITLFDELLTSVTRKIGIESLRLPTFERQLTAKLFNLVNVNASIRIHDGQLFGLTTVARTGDIYLTYKDDIATVEADVGFRNITGTYDWDLKFLGKMSKENLY